MKEKMFALVFLLVILLGMNCFASAVEVYRDSYGVPHVYAKNTEGLYYGFGYTVAQDRLFQLEMLKRMYFGQVAEVLGENYYSLDLFWRNEYPTRNELRQQFLALDKKYQKILNSYAAGINAWIQETATNPDSYLPYEFHQLGFKPNLWTGIDVAATYLTSLGFFMDLSAEMYNTDLFIYLSERYGTYAEEYFDDLVWVADESAYTTIPSANQVEQKVDSSQKNQINLLNIRGLMESIVTYQSNDELNKNLLLIQGHEISEKLKMKASKAASYAVVVGPERSATGNAMLMGGPQFDFWLPSMVHEIGLHGAGLDVVGSTLVGTPFVMFGHTKSTAFTSTAGADNVQDIFEETLNPDHPTQYFFRGKWLEMERRTETILVRGETEPREVTFYRTVHGPVFAQVDTNGNGQPDVAYTKQLSCFDTYLSGISSWTEVMRAKNPEQFVRAGQMLTLSINHLYADSKGNIGYFHSGKYPIRSPRANFDLRLPTPGTGEYEWVGFVDASDNPYVINPSNGLLINWNNKPAKDWNNGDLGSIFLWAGWSEDHRVLRIVDMLEEKPYISTMDIENVIRNIADSDHRAFAVKSYLVNALETSTEPELIQAKNMLKQWNNLRRDVNHDGYYDEPGLTLFNVWWPIVNEKIFGDELGVFGEQLGYNYAGYSFMVRALKGYDANIPLQHDYFNGMDKNWILVESLREAIAQLKSEQGAQMQLWLTPKKEMSFIPAHLGGVLTSLGEVRLIDYMDRGTQNHIIELTKPVASGRNVCPPGQSGFISKEGNPSEHFADQVELFQNWEYKNMLFEKNDILQNSTKKEVLFYKSK